MRKAFLVFFSGLLVMLSPIASADMLTEKQTLIVATASNFTTTLQKIALSFLDETGHVIKVTSGASGKLYTQIIKGAPYDVFLSADVRHPEMLEKNEQIVMGTRFTHAMGRLVLWHPKMTTQRAQDVLIRGKIPHVAMAHPALAPYGKAAQEALVHMKIWPLKSTTNIVQAENVGKTFQFIFSEHAEMGFVSLSQVKERNVSESEYWVIPPSYYSPIQQQTVLLKDTTAGRQFFAFMKSKTVREIIKKAGY